MSEAFPIVAMIIFFYLIYFAIILAVYILRAIGLYKLAKNRGINNAWLAWIPVGDAYIMGCLSEASPYMKHKFPKMHVIYPSIMGGFIFLTITLMFGFFLPNITSVYGLLFPLLVYGLLFLAAIFIRLVHSFILYHIYKIYDPDNVILFLVLSIVMSIDFIFLFVIRNKVPLYVAESTADETEQIS